MFDSVNQCLLDIMIINHRFNKMFHCGLVLILIQLLNIAKIMAKIINFSIFCYKTPNTCTLGLIGNADYEYSVQFSKFKIFLIFLYKYAFIWFKMQVLESFTVGDYKVAALNLTF